MITEQSRNLAAARSSLLQARDALDKARDHLNGSRGTHRALAQVQSMLDKCDAVKAKLDAALIIYTNRDNRK